MSLSNQDWEQHHLRNDLLVQTINHQKRTAAVETLLTLVLMFVTSLAAYVNLSTVHTGFTYRVPVESLIFLAWFIGTIAALLLGGRNLWHQLKKPIIEIKWADNDSQS